MSEREVRKCPKCGGNMAGLHPIEEFEKKLRESGMSEKEIERARKTGELIAKELKKRRIRIEKGITSELEPFLDGIRTMGTNQSNFTLFKEAYGYFEEKFEQKRKLLGHVLGDPAYISPESARETAYTLFAYLGLIESLANAFVDILVMLLVANGRDFHIECRGYRTPRIRHVVSIKDDLEKERVPLGTKLSFLRENNIETLTSIIDSELRNDIAHLKFDIKDDEIFVKGKPASDVVIIGVIELDMALETTKNLLNQLAQERGFSKKE